jgi:hypothetical protein
MNPVSCAHCVLEGTQECQCCTEETTKFEQACLLVAAVLLTVPAALLWITASAIDWVIERIK